MNGPRLIAIVAASLSASSALADGRIRELPYDSSAVIRLAGCPGFQSTVAFGEGEHIENIAIGDASLWQATPNKRADLLFLKPNGAQAHTNMMVVTDHHRYSFELTTRASAVCRAGDMIYDMRFSYPAEPASAPPPAAPRPAPAAPEDPLPAPSARNTAYSYSGTAANVPVRAFDDGRSTWLRWADGVAAPAIYTLGADKSEALVNYAVKGDYIVVDGVAPALVLRRGSSVATLYNDAYQAPGRDSAAPQPRAEAAARPSRLAGLFGFAKGAAR